MATKKGKKASTDAQLLAALASTDYSIYSAAQDELKAWFAAHPAETVARGTKLCDAAARSPKKELREKVGYTVLPVLIAAGIKVAPAWDALLSGFGTEQGLRTVVAAVPRARLLKALAKITAPERARIMEFALDLAPELTTVFLHASWDESKADISAHSDVLKWKQPAIRAQAKKFAAWAKKERKKLPPPPPPPKEAPGTLTFHEPTDLWPEDFASLDAVGKEQYRQAAGAYVGGTVRDGKHFVKRLIADDLDESDAKMRRWQVKQGGQHVFDFWVVWVDNGSLFHAGTKDRVPVHQVQGSFQALEKRPKWIALADDLRRSTGGRDLPF
ncbi:MAG: hypothetical protein U0228_23285 [Myxococcaceae bacterium]